VSHLTAKAVAATKKTKDTASKKPVCDRRNLANTVPPRRLRTSGNVMMRWQGQNRIARAAARNPRIFAKSRFIISLLGKVK
jgi:hypothetical protein